MRKVLTVRSVASTPPVLGICPGPHGRLNWKVGLCAAGIFLSAALQTGAAQNSASNVVQKAQSTTARGPKQAKTVEQLHVLSIHVPDHAAFDSVFRLLRDTLELPLAYGNLSQGGLPDQRLYAGFSVGNSYLEPCGPYSTDPPFAAGSRARFHGLTFSTPDVSVAATNFSRMGIEHSGIMGGGNFPQFVYVRDGSLIGKMLAFSLWKLPSQGDKVALPQLRASLEVVKGGPLGVTCLREVAVALSDDQQSQWRKILQPTQVARDLWTLNAGPQLRILPAAANAKPVPSGGAKGDAEHNPQSATNRAEPKVEYIVLEVRSLSTAKEVLGRKHITWKDSEAGLALDPKDTGGLRIVLSEAAK